jgi:hypothetical protein
MRVRATARSAKPGAHLGAGHTWITEADLIAAGELRGVNFEPRTLTAWRARGLLPKLKPSGRGRGKGKEYGWEDPEVIDQAFAVHELLVKRVKGERALLDLWFCGYAVPSERSRTAWLSQFKRRDASVVSVSRMVGAEGYLASLSRRAARRSDAPPAVSREDLAQAIALVFDASYLGGSDFDPESDRDLFGNVLAGLGGRPPGWQALDDLLTEQVLERLHAAFVAVFSIEGGRQLVATAAAEDLEAARRFLQIVRRVISERMPPDAPSNPFPVIGRMIALLYLAFSRAGLADLLDRSLEIIARESFNKSARYKQRLKKAFSELRGIWSGHSFSTILKRLARR